MGYNNSEVFSFNPDLQDEGDLRVYNEIRDVFGVDPLVDQQYLPLYFFKPRLIRRIRSGKPHERYTRFDDIYKSLYFDEMPEDRSVALDRLTYTAKEANSMAGTRIHLPLLQFQGNDLQIDADIKPGSQEGAIDILFKLNRPEMFSGGIFAEPDDSGATFQADCMGEEINLWVVRVTPDIHDERPTVLINNMQRNLIDAGTPGALKLKRNSVWLNEGLEDQLDPDVNGLDKLKARVALFRKYLAEQTGGPILYPPWDKHHGYLYTLLPGLFVIRRLDWYFRAHFREVAFLSSLELLHNFGHTNVRSFVFEPDKIPRLANKDMEMSFDYQDLLGKYFMNAPQYPGDLFPYTEDLSDQFFSDVGLVAHKRMVTFLQGIT